MDKIVYLLLCCDMWNLKKLQHKSQLSYKNIFTEKWMWYGSCLRKMWSGRNKNKKIETFEYSWLYIKKQ